MKITKRELRQMINESVRDVLNEEFKNYDEVPYNYYNKDHVTSDALEYIKNYTFKNLYLKTHWNILNQLIDNLKLYIMVGVDDEKFQELIEKIKSRCYLLQSDNKFADEDRDDFRRRFPQMHIKQNIYGRDKVAM